MTTVYSMIETINDLELFEAVCEFHNYNNAHALELLHSQYDDVEIELYDLGLHKCDDCNMLMGDGHVHEAEGEFCEPCAGNRWTTEEMRELYEEHEESDYNDGMYWTQWVFT